MSRVTITITDEEDGGIHISLDFDPPVKKGVEGPVSHRAACDFLDWLTQHANVDGESVEVEGEDDGL